MRILRVDATLERTGDTRSPHYDKVAKGLFTKSIKIGERAAGWPEHEVDALIAARIRGDSADQIKKLVAKLHEARRATQPVFA